MYLVDDEAGFSWISFCVSLRAKLLLKISFPIYIFVDEAVESSKKPSSVFTSGAMKEDSSPLRHFGGQNFERFHSLFACVVDVEILPCHWKVVNFTIGKILTLAALRFLLQLHRENQI